MGKVAGWLIRAETLCEVCHHRWDHVFLHDRVSFLFAGSLVNGDF